MWNRTEKSVIAEKLIFLILSLTLMYYVELLNVFVLSGIEKLQHYNLRLII